MGWPKGKPRDPETIRKMSEARKGGGTGPLSPEHKAKISAAHKGKTLSEEHRRKLSESHKGRKMSLEARAKASASLKGRAAWNKGKSMGEATRAKHRGKVMSPETRAKISAKLRGRTHTAEHTAKVAETQRGKTITPEQRERIAASLRGNTPWNKGRDMGEGFREKCRLRPHRSPEIIRRIVESRRASGGLARAAQAKKKFWAEMDPSRREQIIRKMVLASRRHRPSTSIERITRTALDALGITYQAQYPIGRFCADFYLPEWNVDLECDGEYWHGREDVREKDARRDATLVGAGFSVVRLTEADIRADAARAICEALAPYLST